MSYTREDLCNVVGAAFEWLIAFEKVAETRHDKGLLIKRIDCFNRVMNGLKINIEELPKEDTEVAQRFLAGLPRADGKEIKVPTITEKDLEDAED